jgi:hypothetical protein
MISSVVLFNAARDAKAYAWIIIISLYIYCATLLISLRFNSEWVFSKELLFEFIKILFVISFVFLIFEIIITLTGIANLIVSLILTVVIIFVSLSLLNFEYINIAKRR